MSTSPYGYDAVGPGSGYKPGSMRTVGGFRSTTVYPSPFFDIAHTYLPTTNRETFRWCRYYTITNPLIATATHKLASYPITEVLYETDHEGWKRQWQTMLEDQHQIRQFVVEANLDKIAYGNVYISVEFPFRKYLICQSCKKPQPADQARYKFRAFEFYLECKGCGHSGVSKVRDVYIKSPEQIRFVRWNPETIICRYNELTQHRTYFYDLPNHLRNDIILGRPSTIQCVSQDIIEAVRKNQAIVFKEGHLFHARQASVSRFDPGLGVPRLLPVLKDAFYLQLLKKAQEAILIGYVLPLRILFPQPTGGSGGDPYSFLNLGNWKNKVQGEVGKWRQDPLYMPIMPVPVGLQSIGGDGKQLNLANEIRQWSEHIAVGMGIPPEFLFGGLSYSGSSVSLRALENEFLGIREDNLGLLRFLRDKVAWYLGWKPINLRFKPFKMADDLQRAAFDVSLVDKGILSKRTLLEGRDYDFEEEQRRIATENPELTKAMRKAMEAQAETQGKAQLIATRYQIEANKMMQDAMPQPVDPNAVGQEGQPGQQAGQPLPDRPSPSISAAGGIVGVSHSPLTAQNVSNTAQGGVNEDMLSQFQQHMDTLPPEQQSAFLGGMKAKSPDLYGAMLLQRARRQTGTGQQFSRSDQNQGSV